MPRRIIKANGKRIDKWLCNRIKTKIRIWNNSKPLDLYCIRADVLGFLMLSVQKSVRWQWTDSVYRWWKVVGSFTLLLENGLPLFTFANHPQVFQYGSCAIARCRIYCQYYPHPHLSHPIGSIWNLLQPHLGYHIYSNIKICEINLGHIHTLNWHFLQNIHTIFKSLAIPDWSIASISIWSFNWGE